jgi:hypothetical protein
METGKLEKSSVLVLRKYSTRLAAKMFYTDISSSFRMFFYFFMSGVKP